MRTRLAIGTGAAAFALFVVWWAAWRPGFLDATAVDRLAELRSFELTTRDPALYTLWLWVTSIGGRSAALATLAQGAAWAVVAGLAAARWRELGGRPILVGLSIGVVALLPATAVGLLGIYPQAMLAIAAVWLLTEVVAKRRVPWRLGAALGAVAAFGITGAVTAVAVGVVVLFGEYAVSDRSRVFMVAAAVAIMGWLVLPLGMERGASATRLAAPTIASSLAHHPEDFPQAELADIEAVAPLEIWQELYDCADPAALITDREFDEDAISSQRMAELGVRAFVRHPFNAMGQRICAATNLITPALPKGSRYYLPPYTVFPNTIGIERDPVWTKALDATKAILVRTQQADRLVWWWRPAFPVLAAGAVYLLAARRRPRVAGGAAVVVGLLAGVFISGPTPRFEIAYPLYLAGWLSATLASVVVSPTGRRRTPPGS